MMNLWKLGKLVIGVVVTVALVIAAVTNVLSGTAQGATVQIAAEIPEPATFLLVGIGGMLWHRHHNRRR